MQPKDGYKPVKMQSNKKNINLKITIMIKFEFEKAVVSVERTCINPCASDEYKVVVTPIDGSDPIEKETLGGAFEPDSAIAERIYNSINL